MNKKIVIIGAGPTGLGAAYRLQELGYKNWAMYEKNNYVGGLAASFEDKYGFTWDIGGHVLFSHYRYFDDLLNKLLGDEYLEHDRKAYIRIKDRWVPYPFQNNLKYLPKEMTLECVLGLMEAEKKNFNPSNFREWILKIFGNGIAECFMLPHNWKVWAIAPEMMDKNWIAERVSVVDIAKVLRNIIYDQDDTSWGPNSKFKFPLYGGTGEIFRRMLPYVEHNLKMNKKVLEVNVEKKQLKFQDGEKVKYDYLINTSPIDMFINKFKRRKTVLVKSAKKLKHSSGLIVGIGIKKPTVNDRCWVYFPENRIPFYRVTYFFNYSPYNVPNGDIENYSSLMCETSYSEFKSEDKSTIIERTIQGLINSKLLTKQDLEYTESQYLIDRAYTYPIPTLQRDKALKILQEFLMGHDIFSRGRFGAWKYEIGNMDHSVMQGVEVVDRILKGLPEKVFRSA